MDNNESTTTEYPIGLYQDKESKQYIGAIDETQANAFVHTGFSLVKEGRDASMMTDEEIKTWSALPKEEAPAQPEPTKKGK